MTKVKVKVKAQKGKSGTKLAAATLRVAKSDRPSGKPVYQTKAQINVHFENQNGEPRSRGR